MMFTTPLNDLQKKRAVYQLLKIIRRLFRVLENGRITVFLCTKHSAQGVLPSYQIINRIKKLGIFCFYVIFPWKKGLYDRFKLSQKQGEKKAEFWINMKAGVDIRAVDFGKEQKGVSSAGLSNQLTDFSCAMISGVGRLFFSTVSVWDRDPLSNPSIPV